jgi:hypothetical protein
MPELTERAVDARPRRSPKAPDTSVETFLALAGVVELTRLVPPASFFESEAEEEDGPVPHTRAGD